MNVEGVFSKARDSMLRRVIPSSDDPLWHKWSEDYAALLEAEARRDAERDGLDESVIESCRARLEVVSSLLANGARWSAQQSLMIYRLLHQVDGDLLLVVPPEDLGGRAIDVKDQFDKNVGDKLLRDEWLESGHLEGVVRRCVEGAASSNGEVLAVQVDDSGALVTPAAVAAERVRLDRRLLRHALRVVNEITDREFWRYAMNMRLQIWSTVILIALLAIEIPIEWHHLTRSPVEMILPMLPWPSAIPATHLLWLAIGLGAIGAVVSNMLAEREFKVPYGQAFQSYVYYLIVVPIVGAVAALFVLAVERSGLLFTVQQLPAASQALASGGAPPLLIKVGSPAAEDLTRAVMAVVAGFFGDRALRDTMGRVFEDLFGRATKEKAVAEKE